MVESASEAKSLGLGFHLPVGRIILHNTVLVELDLCLEPAALVLICSVAEVRVGLLAQDESRAAI